MNILDDCATTEGCVRSALACAWRAFWRNFGRRAAAGLPLTARLALLERGVWPVLRYRSSHCQLPGRARRILDRVQRRIFAIVRGARPYLGEGPGCTPAVALDHRPRQPACGFVEHAHSASRRRMGCADWARPTTGGLLATCAAILAGRRVARAPASRAGQRALLVRSNRHERIARPRCAKMARRARAHARRCGVGRRAPERGGMHVRLYVFGDASTRAPHTAHQTAQKHDTP